MVLDSSMLADLRELAATEDLVQLENLSFSHATVGGIVDLACMRSSATEPLRAVFDIWASSSPVLENAFRVLENGRLPSTSEMWSGKRIEFFPIRGPMWSEPIHFHPFESRFRKAAVEAGFGVGADGLASALFEMADNIPQHSASRTSCSTSGLIGYFVEEGHVAFAVGDLGRGMLASLKENPAWDHLTNSKDALLAVIHDHASRRSGLGQGEGFKQVLRSLVERNGLLFLSSLEGRLTLRQRSDGEHAVVEFINAFPGVQLSVNCSLRGAAREQNFPIDNLT
jgi:hypothetical protein